MKNTKTRENKIFLEKKYEKKINHFLGKKKGSQYIIIIRNIYTLKIFVKTLSFENF